MAETAVKVAEANKQSGKKGKGKKKEDAVDLPALQQETQVAEEKVRAYEEGEAGIWANYTSLVVGSRAV